MGLFEALLSVGRDPHTPVTLAGKEPLPLEVYRQVSKHPACATARGMKHTNSQKLWAIVLAAGEGTARALRFLLFP